MAYRLVGPSHYLTNAVILLIRTIGTSFREILSEIHTFSLKKIYLKMPWAKWCQFCLGLNVLISSYRLCFSNPLVLRRCSPWFQWQPELPAVLPTVVPLAAVYCRHPAGLCTSQSRQKSTAEMGKVFPLVLLLMKKYIVCRATTQLAWSANNIDFWVWCDPMYTACHWIWLTSD